MQVPTKFGLSIAFLLSQVTTFYLMAKRCTGVENCQSRILDTAEAVSCRIIVVLSMLVLLTTQSPSSWVPIVLSGVLKAMWWISVVVLVCHSTTVGAVYIDYQ